MTACSVWLASILVLAAQPGDGLPAIRLFNPTAWEGPALVEVPTGRIAAPGLIDWSNVHLTCAGKRVAFAIREGRAHWKARLIAPVESPQAEDLIVFSYAVPPGEWVRVDVVNGSPDETSALKRETGRCVVTYADTTAVIDEKTGLLLELTVRGESVLAGPLGIAPHRLAGDGYAFSGHFGPGYAEASIKPTMQDRLPFRARLASSSSSPAMTELNFVIETDGGPDIALTYRMYAHGAVEIWADERPWQGESPWVDHAVEYALPLKGRAEPLPYLEDRFGFYTFKSYAASMHCTARLHRMTSVGVLELGEQAVNGRRWMRRLFTFPRDREAQAHDLVELVDEGLIVDVLPVRTQVLPKSIKIACPARARAAGERLARTLKRVGLQATLASESTSSDAIRVELVDRTETDGITGDGFAIRPRGSGGWSVRAGTVLGLYKAAGEIDAHLRRHGDTAGLPLIARNPVVDLRGGGFGGGQVEVDFPYGSDEEWERTFESLIDSGMNVFWSLGMWGNWKMPVGYKYMPELRSDVPDAYDESSGAKFAELEYHRTHGLKLIRFLQDRGARAYVWLPIGCVPTTFAQQFPKAMAPESTAVPCFTHPEYRRYVDAFLRELTETYPLDGVVLVRDDNGGLCTCDRCGQHVAQSRTRSHAWEQYLIIHEWLRRNGFRGMIAVYPYRDRYEPRLDPLLPDDVYVVGHGGGAAVLARDYERIGPMGDTWLDNLYANFRLPPSPRMRRLLSDRGTLWIGGAYVGTELPWEALGYFGWEPTATANTFRHEWGVRTFGKDHALRFVNMSNDYEHLWELNALPMLPAEWMTLNADERKGVVAEGLAGLKRYRASLAALKQAVGQDRHARWFGHMDLFAPFFEYHLRRLDLFAQIYDLVLTHRVALERGERLPETARTHILSKYEEMYAWAAKYKAAMDQAPDGMLTHCRWMTSPYKEWMAGYDQWLEPRLEVRQFAGTVRADAPELRAGAAFTLAIELHNTGVCPWIPAVGQYLELTGVAERLGLPPKWDYAGEPMAPGDRRTIVLKGVAPGEPGQGELKLALRTPFRSPSVFAKADVALAWK